MRILKFLQFSLLVAGVCAAAGLTALCAGCAGGPPSSPAAAEKFAVSLANDRCEKEYGKRPFKTGHFPATRSGDRWLWGWLDAGEAQGFTAQVSFRADRTQPDARIYSMAGEPFDMEAPNATPMEATPMDARPDSATLSQHPDDGVSQTR